MFTSITIYLDSFILLFEQRYWNANMIPECEHVFLEYEHASRIRTSGSARRTLRAAAAVTECSHEQMFAFLKHVRILKIWSRIILAWNPKDTLKIQLQICIYIYINNGTQQTIFVIWKHYIFPKSKFGYFLVWFEHFQNN